jgi:hypothetical protein
MEQQRMMKNLSSTELSDTKNIVIAPEYQERFIHLPLNKKDKYFSNPADLVKFIKDTEKEIRTSKEYSNYIRYLKQVVGLRNCALFKNIDDSKAPIEMHHGPIFTLFDIVEIQIAYFYKKNIPINSARLTHHILKDHWNNLIQVVMLCKTAHDMVGNLQKLRDKAPPEEKKKYFLSGDGSWGNINAFILKYHEAFSINHYNKIINYIKDYKTYMNQENKTAKSELFITRITKWASIIEDKRS